MSRFLGLLAALAVIVAALALSAGSAWAHERRTVGSYQLVVGFLTEPGYSGQPNGLDLRVTDTRTTQPVEGLEKTLKAEVSFGGLAPLPLTVTARFGQTGAYAGQFVPTKPGTYIFHISGKIGTQDIDERFESGPNRFNDIEGLGALQYPDKVPGGSDLGKALADLRSENDQLRLLVIAGVVVAIVIAIAVPVVLSRRRG
ncbi:MAG TPA: hypothetical protein VM070_02620 [Candidatus Saccharimonadales bacterium]|nr:hypothetical protein [Candidatus Saccharimonadales bacterium]